MLMSVALIPQLKRNSESLIISISLQTLSSKQPSSSFAEQKVATLSSHANHADYLIKNGYMTPELVLQKAPWEINNIKDETNGWVVLSQNNTPKEVDVNKSSMMSWISSDKQTGATRLKPRTTVNEPEVIDLTMDDD
jgi:hypothetical protein